MVLSVIVALTLTPALCATILKPHKEENSKGLQIGLEISLKPLL
jgi:multidrug efflux pump subunit AcrB